MAGFTEILQDSCKDILNIGVAVKHWQGYTFVVIVF